MSQDFFDAYVRPQLRRIRRGALQLVAVAEIERWLRENAARTLHA